MQHGEVPREPGHPQAPQRGECLGHGRAHEAERPAVGGQAPRVGAAPVQGRGDAGHEGGMVGQPAIHVSHALDREAAPVKRSGQLIEARIVSRLEGGRLLFDADVLSGPVTDDTADAGEPELDLARDRAGDPRPTAGVVPEEDHGRRSRKCGELTGRRSQLITADGDQDKIEGTAGRVGNDADAGLGPAAVQDVMRRQPVPGHILSAWRVAEDRDRMPRAREVRAVHSADHARPHNQHSHSSLRHV